MTIKPADTPRSALGNSPKAAVTRGTAGHGAPQQRRFWVGFVLLTIGVAIGVATNVVLWSKTSFLTVCGGPQATRYIASLTIIAAYVPVLLYLLVPKLLDRFDPEPWWALLGVFLWGATFATGISGWVNGATRLWLTTALGSEVARVATVVAVAPSIEELCKAGAIWGMVFFLRREFDGMVDGVIYATFVAIGFAATENLVYYAGATCGTDATGAFERLFVARGILTPWLHPLFTVMTGLGFGLAREHGARWARVLLPITGLLAAIFLHTLWNAVVSRAGRGASEIAIALGTAMAASFIYLLWALTKRKGRIIRDFLHDEIALGYLSPQDVERISSPTAPLRNFFARNRRRRRAFLRAGNRLAMCKWHTARAMRTSQSTISAGRIGSLRKQVIRFRG